MRSDATIPVGALGVGGQSQHATPPQPARRTASKERSYFRASNELAERKSDKSVASTAHENAQLCSKLGVESLMLDVRGEAANVPTSKLKYYLPYASASPHIGGQLRDSFFRNPKDTFDIHRISDCDLDMSFGFNPSAWVEFVAFRKRTSNGVK